MTPRPAGRGRHAGCIGVLLCAALAGCASATTPASARNGRADELAGSHWSVVRVADPDGTLTVPRSAHAAIGYTNSGVSVGNDTRNGIQGRYRPTGTGYRLTDSVAGAVGGTGGDPDATRTVADIDAMFIPSSTSHDVRGRAHVDVSVRLHGHTLVLSHGSTTVTLVRAGR